MPFWSLILPWGVCSLCLVDNFLVLSAGLFSQLLWGWGRDAGSSLPINHWHKEELTLPSQETQTIPKGTEKGRDAGLDTQQADDFPVCPLGHKLKMSPRLLSYLLRDSSLLSCTNPPLNPTWSTTTLHLYHSTSAGAPLGCLVPVQSIPSSSVRGNHGSVPGCAVWHSFNLQGHLKGSLRYKSPHQPNMPVQSI